MGVFETVMKLFTYLFHLLLALVMLGLACVAWLSRPATFKMGVLPWEGRSLACVLLVSGLVGIVSVYLAFRKILPAMLLVWSLVVLLMLLRGFFFSSYHFGRAGLSTAVFLILGAAIAAGGSWLEVRQKPER